MNIYISYFSYFFKAYLISYLFRWFIFTFSHILFLGLSVVDRSFSKKVFFVDTGKNSDRVCDYRRSTATRSGHPCNVLKLSKSTTRLFLLAN